MDVSPELDQPIIIYFTYGTAYADYVEIPCLTILGHTYLVNALYPTAKVWHATLGLGELTQLGEILNGWAASTFRFSRPDGTKDEVHCIISAATELYLPPPVLAYYRRVQTTRSRLFCIVSHPEPLREREQFSTQLKSQHLTNAERWSLSQGLGIHQLDLEPASQARLSL